MSRKQRNKIKVKKSVAGIGTTAEVKINLNGENMLVTVESLERTFSK